MNTPETAVALGGGASVPALGFAFGVLSSVLGWLLSLFSCLKSMSLLSLLCFLGCKTALKFGRVSSGFWYQTLKRVLSMRIWPTILFLKSQIGPLTVFLALLPFFCLGWVK